MATERSGVFFFLAASVEVLLDEASIYVESKDASKVTKLLDVLKVSHGEPKDVAKVKGTCIIGANVRLLIDILWTASVITPQCVIDVNAFDVKIADDLIDYWKLRLGKTMTQSYRFFGSIVLSQIMQMTEEVTDGPEGQPSQQIDVAEAVVDVAV